MPGSGITPGELRQTYGMLGVKSLLVKSQAVYVKARVFPTVFCPVTQATLHPGYILKETLLIIKQWTQSYPNSLSKPTILLIKEFKTYNIFTFILLFFSLLGPHHMMFIGCSLLGGMMCEAEDWTKAHSESATCKAITLPWCYCSGPRYFHL